MNRVTVDVAIIQPFDRIAVAQCFPADLLIGEKTRAGGDDDRVRSIMRRSNGNDGPDIDRRRPLGRGGTGCPAQPGHRLTGSAPDGRACNDPTHRMGDNVDRNAFRGEVAVNVVGQGSADIHPRSFFVVTAVFVQIVVAINSVLVPGKLDEDACIA